MFDRQDQLQKIRSRLEIGDRTSFRILDNEGELRYFTIDKILGVFAAYLDAIVAAEQFEASCRDRGRREFVYVDEVEVRKDRVNMSLVIENETRMKGGAK